MSRRDRSLVTLGILIALGASDELKFHFKIARNNGLTDEELAEVIYHATGYAGVPAAATAKRVAEAALTDRAERSTPQWCCCLTAIPRRHLSCTTTARRSAPDSHCTRKNASRA